MRALQNSYMQFGQVDISKIKFDPKSRDDMPQILRGLQHLYVDPKIREEIFAPLEKNILPKVDKKNGRPGMELWKILVLGVLRLDLNWDYDRLHDSANNHVKIRQMLGHPDGFDEYYYELQTLKDNVSLLTPELLDQINQIVVRTGHLLLKKKENEALRGRCDSFVVETNVHYPTDINLLWDALRKVIVLTARLCERYEFSAWRQSAHNLRHVKRLMRHAQNTKRSRSKREARKERQERLMVKAHQDYISVAGLTVKKVEDTLDEQNVKFLTIRRRGKKIVSELEKLSKTNWKSTRVSMANGKTRLVRVNDTKVFLKEYGQEIRQVAITGHGRLKPALIITNDFELGADTVIRKYARRWLVEKTISEQTHFFHLNRMSSSMVIKVDFDLTMTILAHNLYRVFASHLTGHAHNAAVTLYEKFIQNSGSVAISDQGVIVKIKKKRNLPLLLTMMDPFQKTKVKWLNNLPIQFAAATHT